MKNTHFTLSQIKDRGWTDVLIKKYLPEPCLLKNNPVFSSASQMKLYTKTKVYGIERRKLFKEDRIKAEERKNRAKKAVGTKIKNLLEKIKDISFSLDLIDKHSLIRLSIQSYNDFYGDRDYFSPSTRKSNPEFLDRICVNYLRHELTSYDDELFEIYNKTGKQLAYKIIKTSVLELIAEKYPYLKDECTRQLSRIE